MRKGSPLGGLRDWYPLTLKILTESVVELCQPAELEVGHRLLVLLDLRRIANVTGGVGRHIESLCVSREVIIVKEETRDWNCRDGRERVLRREKVLQKSRVD